MNRKNHISNTATSLPIFLYTIIISVTPLPTSIWYYNFHLWAPWILKGDVMQNAKSEKKKKKKLCSTTFLHFSFWTQYPLFPCLFLMLWNANFYPACILDEVEGSLVVHWYLFLRNIHFLSYSCIKHGLLLSIFYFVPLFCFHDQIGYTFAFSSFIYTGLIHFNSVFIFSGLRHYHLFSSFSSALLFVLLSCFQPKLELSHYALSSIPPPLLLYSFTRRC